MAPERVAEAIWGALRRPRKQVYVPGVFRLASGFRLAMGWAMDRFSGRYAARTRRRS